MGIMKHCWLSWTKKIFQPSETTPLIDPDMFFELLDRLSPRIEKQDTWYWKALQSGLKVAITLWYLATDDSYHILMNNFRVAHNTISSIVRDVCQAIIDEYAREVIAAPTTEAEW